MATVPKKDVVEEPTGDASIPAQSGDGRPLPTSDPRDHETGDVVSRQIGVNSGKTRDNSTNGEADTTRRRKNMRNRRKRANKQKRRVPKEPRVKLTPEERERVCALLREFHKDPEPILRTVRRNIAKDRRGFLMSPHDKSEIEGEVSVRLVKYMDRCLVATNPWAYSKKITSNCIYDYLNHRKHHLRVTFRRRARIRSLIKRLRLNKADIISDTRDEDGKRTLELWATTGQVKELRCHDQVESYVVLLDNVNLVSIEEVDVIDPSNAVSDWESLEDIKTAHRILQPEMKKPAAVFGLFVFQKLQLGEVAKLLGLSVRWCRELLHRFIRRMVERFSELKEDLIRILRPLW